MRFTCLFLLVSLLSSSGFAAADCQLARTYTPYQGLGVPAFYVRTGYSRDNDDHKQGHYETAVMDFELIGVPSSNPGSICLYLYSQSVLEEDIASADNWAKNWFVRTAGRWELDETKLAWKQVEQLGSRVTVSTVERHPSASYLQHIKMPSALQRRRDGRQAVALTSTLFLGKVPSKGRFFGRIFFQSPSSRTAAGLQFENADSRDYNVVRHVVEWRLDLANGLPNRVNEVQTELLAGTEVRMFASQIRLVKADWEGTEVTDPRTHEREVKNQSASLLWRDVAVVGTDATTGKAAYLRTNLMEALFNPAASKVATDEVKGRIVDLAHRVSYDDKLTPFIESAF